jgi:cytochrome c-type biogenesis protein CcmH
MHLFWTFAALMAGACAVLVMARAARAGGPAQDPSLELHRRALAEVDDLAARGLIDAEDVSAIRTEAARRLLRSADAPELDLKPLKPAFAVALAVVAPVLALAVYVFVGAPGLDDQPFAKRLAAWRSHPEQASAAELAATLRALVVERPYDPAPREKLAQVALALGDADGAAHALRSALALAPDRTDLAMNLAMTLVLKNKGTVTPEAHDLFTRALAVDARAPMPRYMLGREAIAKGRIAEGLAMWKALAGELAADDKGKADLQKEIDTVERTGALPPMIEDAAAAPPSQDAIQAMVARLAARLKANPDDPAGWARLIRSYTVLHDTARRDSALAEARRRFAARPDVLSALDEAAKGP